MAPPFLLVRTINLEFKKYVNYLKKYKVKIQIIHLDLLDTKSISGCINEIYKTTKDIDILVNNAGILFNALFQMTSEKNLKKYFK